MEKILKDTIEKINNKMEILFKDENTGHDISHLRRVLDNAIKIQAKEGGDLYVIAVASLVHDIHRLLSNKTGQYVSPEQSLDEVEKILIDCDVDDSKIPSILEVVKYHEQKDKKNIPIEWQVLQDADSLDALGDIGLKRTIQYCQTHHIPRTNKKYDLNCKEYIPNIMPISTCHYVYRTMIPQGENMHTKTGQIMANENIEILKKFVIDSLNADTKE